MNYSLRDILQENKTARLGNKDKWLTWNDIDGWVVKQQNKIIYTGTVYTQSIDKLLEE